MRIVLASNNPGKLAELKVLIAPLGWDAVSQRDLGIPRAPETRNTFVENALEKARHVTAAAGMPAIADDSGLAVHALGGAPGVRSARYAGEDATDAENNAELIAAMAEIDDRRASFHCAVVFMRSPDDPVPVIATAAWNGHIVAEPRGAGGFGYDPHFFVDEMGCTAAELDPAVKNEISHRGKAMCALCAQLAEAV
ncbi:MAG: RdgB/HAM1 family non-canonical purine NTP pyrophosphatase [Pseudomonadales bacterium]|nr:RdgB/HAM1 family non-canonical purine NTP pyrophosphatase [Pseudomonadales bacterium]NIX07604.1 RdgB/HAM1 family non-canonical purine NTP pyrophosphatase [Pseudomonadales bacterium]